MNVLLSVIGRRGYIADYFRDAGAKKIVGTSDRHGEDSEFTVGFGSADRNYVLPSVNSDRYVDTLLQVCEDEEIEIVTSLFDQDCHVLSDHLDAFRDLGVLPFLPTRRASDICLDKVETVRFLNEAGIQGPATFLSVEEFSASGIGYPVVVKPRFGFASLDMHFVSNERELRGCFDPSRHIIQQMLKGQEFSFDVLMDVQGKVISCVVKRKIKMRAGETDQAITVKNKALLELGVAIGEAMGYAGPLDVDLFVDGDDVRILELNPRFGGGYPASHAAGAMFPDLMVEMAKGRSPKSILGSYRENIVMMKRIAVDSRPITAMTDNVIDRAAQ